MEFVALVLIVGIVVEAVAFHRRDRQARFEQPRGQERLP